MIPGPSSMCCICAGTCCHTGPHMYCQYHGPPQQIIAYPRPVTVW